MKAPLRLLLLAISIGHIEWALAHDLSGDPDHPHYDWSVKPPGADSENAAPSTGSHPGQAEAFEAFSPLVQVHWDERFLFVESQGLPAHDMMIGITNWQQQVPLPQDYTGTNAWRIPLTPVVARSPLSIKGRFLRGAIALAANGIPIFNPQNNRGEISAEIGELDQWGGHCGRADDYHYHAAPLHLQSVLGKDKPIAYALDGYAIFGLTEPDGSALTGLDAFHGHSTTALGYHYHASKTYPYINGGFHGEVAERDGQVDPQPRAQPVRPALPPLRGAKIVGFERKDGNYKLNYEVAAKAHTISYTVHPDGVVDFEVDGATKETYTRGNGRAEKAPPKRATSLDAVETNPVQKPNGTFTLTSSAVTEGGNLPTAYTGDGRGVTPPLAWKGAPAGTRSYALIMDHLAPGNEIKTYWTVWDIPADVTNLPEDVKGVGQVGTSFKGRSGYEPPHSQGPGQKIYVLTVYALSAPVRLTEPPDAITREKLLAAMKDKVLASASLQVAYTRDGKPETDRKPTHDESPPQKRPGQASGKGAAKAAMTDTMQGAIYADNWFALYINGRLTVVDPIAFLPHNVVSVDLLPEYPMTIAVIAHDNADPKTGLEYGDHIGDAGFILKFADGTVTDGTWKAKSIERGPIGGDIANPRVETEPRPANWFAPDFDDSKWESATVFTEEQVNPKQPYFEHDFKGAQFIWSKELGLDNTVLFRKRIEKPGWKPRWSAQPSGPLPAP